MKMEEINIEELTNFCERLTRLGFKAVENPNNYKAFIGQYGSIANYKKVTLGKLRYVPDPCGEVHLGVFVDYEAESEAGEDLCDFYIHEKRTLTVDDLFKWLAERGIKERS